MLILRMLSVKPEERPTARLALRRRCLQAA
jgi:hypothetical protein